MSGPGAEHPDISRQTCAMHHLGFPSQSRIAIPVVDALSPYYFNETTLLASWPFAKCHVDATMGPLRWLTPVPGTFQLLYSDESSPTILISCFLYSCIK